MQIDQQSREPRNRPTCTAHWFLTKEQKQSNAGRGGGDVFSANNAVTTGHAYEKKINFNPYLTPYIQWIWDGYRPKYQAITIKLL